MKPEQERLQNLLCETITMLCKNGLSYKRELRVQGLVAVTIDDNDVFIVHLNERLEDAVGGFVIPADCNGLPEPQQPNSCSSSSEQQPDTSKNLADDDGGSGATVRPFGLFNGCTDSAAPAETDDDSSCKILKVEPLTDDGEEDGPKDDSMNVDEETEEEQMFTVGLACSSSQNVAETISYRFLRESNSSALEVSRTDFGADAKAAVALVSAGIRSCVRDRVPIPAGAVQQVGETFQNILPSVGGLDPALMAVTDSGSHAKIPLSKLMRNYLPMVPSFAARQQAIAKGERPLLFLSQRQTSRLPRRPRESTEKHFICPFCGLSYYYKKHLKFHLRQKHGF